MLTDITKELDKSCPIIKSKIENYRPDWINNDLLDPLRIGITSMLKQRERAKKMTGILPNTLEKPPTLTFGKQRQTMSHVN